MLKLSFELHGLSERIRFIELHQQALNVSLKKFKMYRNKDKIFTFFYYNLFIIYSFITLSLFIVFFERNKDNNNIK